LKYRARVLGIELQRAVERGLRIGGSALAVARQHQRLAQEREGFGVIGIEPGRLLQRGRGFGIAFGLEIGPAQHAPAFGVFRIGLQLGLQLGDHIVDRRRLAGIGRRRRDYRGFLPAIDGDARRGDGHDRSARQQHLAQPARPARGLRSRAFEGGTCGRRLLGLGHRNLLAAFLRCNRISRSRTMLQGDARRALRRRPGSGRRVLAQTHSTRSTPLVCGAANLRVAKPGSSANVRANWGRKSVDGKQEPAEVRFRVAGDAHR
jgi:hypothetical protein